MSYLQKLFSFFINPFAGIIGSIDQRIRNATITICCMCLVGYFLIYFNPVFHIRFKLTFDHIICSVVLFVLIIASVDRKLVAVKWNPWVSYTFFLSGLGILLISFLHPVGSGYRAFALMMMFGFPCMYYVWNNRGDYRALYDRLAAATAVVGVLYYAYCFYLAHTGQIRVVDERVEGRFSDSNMFSMLGMIMVCSALYMLLVNRDRWMWFLLTALSLGAGISIMKLGVSRLAILVALGSMFAFTIYYLQSHSSFKHANSLIIKFIRAWILLIVVVVLILSGNIMLDVNSKAIAKQEAATMELENAIEEPMTDVAATTEPETEDTGDTNIDAVDRFRANGQDLDTYTAGRYHIWKGYAQFLNLTGNDFSKADWDVLTWDSVRHAHNNFLEIAFRCGVPVALLHVFLELLAGVICLIWLFNPKYKDPVYFFAISFMVCYTVQSLFDIATLPFERPAPFYFYMSLVPAFTFSLKDSNNK